MAREEELCYRSSLYLSLTSASHSNYKEDLSVNQPVDEDNNDHPEPSASTFGANSAETATHNRRPRKQNGFFPLPSISAIYSSAVLIIRSSLSTSHTLLIPQTSAFSFPTVSVISVAALRLAPISATGGFENPDDRSAAKAKMRLMLRAGAHEGHSKLVLGSMGCRAFRNPGKEVALCWREVLLEEEFAGSWWEALLFAVMDSRHRDGEVGNHGIFAEELEGS